MAATMYGVRCGSFAGVDCAKDVLAIVDPLQAIVVGLALQTLLEVLVIAQRLWRPSCLGHSSQAGQHQILHVVGRYDPLGPKVGLHAQIFRLQFGGDILHRYIVVHSFDRLRALTLRMGLGGQIGLLAVDIVGDLWRQDRVETALSSILGSAIRTNPCHDGDVLTQ